MHADQDGPDPVDSDVPADRASAGQRRLRMAVMAALLCSIVAPVAYVFAGLDRLSPETGTLWSWAELGIMVIAPIPVVVIMLSRGFGKVLRDLDQRDDSEHEQMIVRIVLMAIIVVYTSASLLLSDDIHPLTDSLMLAAPTVLTSWMLLAHLLLAPGTRWSRRVAGMLLDNGFLSIYLIIGGEHANVAFAVYLWVSLGNGFRYGVVALALSAAFSTVGFSIVVASTPYWWERIYEALGLILALMALPAYVSTLIRKLTEAKAAAEEANRAKSRFLATMSHELRTPLTAIIGAGDLLKSASLANDDRNLVVTVNAAARALLGLINDILDLSRIEAAKLNLVPAPFDLANTVAGVRLMLQAQAKAKGLRFRTEWRVPFSATLMGDEQRFQQILINLAANAIKFTPSGEVGVIVSGRRVGQIAEMTVEVTDTGVGIPADRLPRIFESFTQVDDSTNRRFGGSGLGLTIARQLAEMMDGRISVASAPGIGSRFSVVIPFAIADEEIDSAKIPVDEPVLLVGGGSGRHGPTASLMRTAGLTVTISQDARSAYRHIAESSGTAERVVLVSEPMGEMQADPIGAAFATLLRDRPLEGVTLIMLDRSIESASEALKRWPVDVVVHSTDDVGSILSALQRAVLLASMNDVARSDDPVTIDAHQIAPRVGRRVLLVDDNRTIQRVISKILEQAGHDVTVAEDGTMALDVLEEQSFDIVLMDVNMPQVSGIEATRMLRFMYPSTGRIPVVALTAGVTDQVRRQCEDAGMDGVLPKPVDRTQLLDMIDRLALDPQSEIVAAADVQQRVPAAPSRAVEAHRAARGQVSTSASDGDVTSAEGLLGRGGPWRPVTTRPSGPPMPPPPVSAPAPGSISRLDEHPRFGRQSTKRRPPEPSADIIALDESVIQSLVGLTPDGVSFVAGLVEEFIEDATETVASLEEALSLGDAMAFKDGAHALRSSSAYLGATRMATAVSAVRDMDPKVFAADGPERLREIREAFDALCPALRRAVDRLES